MALAAGADPDWDPPGIQVHPDVAAAARGEPGLKALIADGRRLFATAFNRHDGAGRPAATGDAKPTRRLVARGDPDRLAGPDATSCGGCHARPTLGGAGDFAAGVFVASATRYAVATPDQGNAQVIRRPPSLFGAGLVELLAREMTSDLFRLRDAALARARAEGRDVAAPLSSKGISFGVLRAHPDSTYDADEVRGVDPDLVVRPFGWRGQAVSIREITITAANQHHGMEAEERFGWARTGRRDFDEDGVEVELTAAHVTALSVFAASLPPPSTRAPGNPTESATWARGRQSFERAGCADCHRPRLPLSDPAFTEPGPFNPPGTLRAGELAATVRLPVSVSLPRVRAPRGPVQVPAFTDLKRHLICDDEDAFFCDEGSTRDGRPVGEFLTARLWSVGQGPPYGHHGRCGTVSDAIVHHSGEAAPARRAFLALPEADQRAVVAFLMGLGAAQE